MANKVQILSKIARNAELLGLTINSNTGSAIVIENGANDLTVSYVDADIQKPMGGIDDTASPFLGIGVANPGKIKLKSAINTAGDITDVLDGILAVKVFQLMCGFANALVIENSDASFSEELLGHPDVLNLGS
jgi:hypothetical protein